MEAMGPTGQVRAACSFFDRIALIVSAVLRCAHRSQRHLLGNVLGRQRQLEVSKRRPSRLGERVRSLVGRPSAH